MITPSSDPIGTLSGIKMSGGSAFIYESEPGFDLGWAITLWFKKNVDPLPDRLIDLQDITDSNNDLRIYFEGNFIYFGAVPIAWAPTGDWEFLFITSIQDSGDIYYSLNGNPPQQITPGSIPLNPKIIIGKTPERYFTGEIWDIRIYDKILSLEAMNTLYSDVINNQGAGTIPL